VSRGVVFVEKTKQTQRTTASAYLVRAQRDEGGVRARQARRDVVPEKTMSLHQEVEHRVGITGSLYKWNTV
jgi:hypothetical protein